MVHRKARKSRRNSLCNKIVYAGAAASIKFKGPVQAATSSHATSATLPAKHHPRQRENDDHDVHCGCGHFSWLVSAGGPSHDLSQPTATLPLNTQASQNVRSAQCTKCTIHFIFHNMMQCTIHRMYNPLNVQSTHSSQCTRSWCSQCIAMLSAQPRPYISQSSREIRQAVLHSPALPPPTPLVPPCPPTTTPPLQQPAKASNLYFTLDPKRKLPSVLDDWEDPPHFE